MYIDINLFLKIVVAIQKIFINNIVIWYHYIFFLLKIFIFILR